MTGRDVRAHSRSFGIIDSEKTFGERGARIRTRTALAVAGALLCGIGFATLDVPAFADTETPIQSFSTNEGEVYPIATQPANPKDPGAVIFAITNGGSYNCGSLLKLTRQSNGTYQVQSLHDFLKPQCNPTTLVLSPRAEWLFVTFQSGYFANFDFTGKELSEEERHSISLLSYFSRGLQPRPGLIPSGSTTAVIVAAAGGTSSQGGVYLSTVSSAGVLSAPALIFSFPGEAGGAAPEAAAELGPDGNLYGTTQQGGNTTNAACVNVNGCGIVYRLTPPASGTTWTENVLYTFSGGKDGGQPVASVAFDAGGNVYGTTFAGGNQTGSIVGPCGTYGIGKNYGCGVAFQLTKSATAPWPEHVLHAFTDGKDGGQPFAPVVLDSKGNVYGTTLYGGDLVDCQRSTTGNPNPGCGAVFKLLPPLTVGTYPWRPSVLYDFTGKSDGGNPVAGVFLGLHNTVFGATVAGGDTSDSTCAANDPYTNSPGCGVVFKLAP